MKKTENKSGKSGMQVMKKLMAFIGNYKIFLGLSIVLAAVTVILQLYIPILFGDAIDEVVAAHQVNFPEMWFYLKRIVFFTLVSALSAWIMNLINNRMTYRIVRDLRSQAIRHIQVLPLSYLAAFVLGWPPAAVYFCTRIDQCYKWIIAFFRLRGNKWIKNVTREDAMEAQS